MRALARGVAARSSPPATDAEAVMLVPPVLKSVVDLRQLEGGELGGLKLAVRGGGTGALALET